MNNLIYDANFLVGFIDKNDKWHKKTIDIHEDIKAKGFGIIYFDCVANEVVSILGKRLEERKMAVKFKDVMSRFKESVPKEKLSWIYPDIIKYYDKILDLMIDNNGKINFHDALLAISAKNMGLKYIVSFDQDFDEIDWLVRVKDVMDVKNIPLE